MPDYTDYDVVFRSGLPALNLSDSELRETAYEILVGACRSTSVRPLTYIPQSERTERAPTPSLTSAPSLQRSLTSTAASRVKEALGMKSIKKRVSGSGGSEAVSEGKVRRAVTVGELVRAQMRIPEQTDSRIRRALLRIAAGQLGKRIETMVLPLELLQQIKSKDFPSEREYEAWMSRNFKLLRAGLLVHPHLPFDNANTDAKRLHQIIRGALERPLEIGKNYESMQAFRSVVMSLACRSLDGSVSEKCHWADGYPLNLRIYQALLEACFDVNEAISVVEEVDEVLELIKKTWEILGINQMLHNLCFCWILFNRYVSTGQMENDLLFAANNLLLEVEKDAKTTRDADYSKYLSSTLCKIQDWAEPRLCDYHGSFHHESIDTLGTVVSLRVLSAKILVEDIHDYHKKKKHVDVDRDRVDTYIRSSLRTSYSQKVNSSKKLSKNLPNHLPLLSILAQEVTELAFDEKTIFSPILNIWHPLAAGVAVATLHSCYGNLLKQFVSGITELTPDAIQVLLAADKLEKNLVQIAVEDSVDSEDGGKSIIQEMPPYEAEAAIGSLAKSWINIRVDRLKEWVHRTLQQEVWNLQANKQSIAPSAVEALQTVDKILEAFFMLPIPMHSLLLPELISGLDGCLQHYILKAKAGSGSRSTFIPALPGLTRCTMGSKFGVFKRKENLPTAIKRKPQVETTDRDNPFGVPQLCCRINTFQHIRMQLGVLEKKTVHQLRRSHCMHADNITDVIQKSFDISTASCGEGIKQLSEAIAFKVIFHNLSHFLWDGLYVGEVSSSRIEPFLQELEHHLEIISSTVHDRVRTRVITEIMKASFEGFMLVLLAGGPSRAFTHQDSDLIEEDFKSLKDLFWSNGDGLPADVIDKFSTTVKSVLPLYHTDTESLVEEFKRLTFDSRGSSEKNRLQVPSTSGHWDPNEPNTVLRVLCHRSDHTAVKFLKKMYNLPKKL